MLLQRTLFFSILVCYILLTRSDDQLQIISTYKPEGCEKGPLSVSGERLAVHYTGSIDVSSRTGTPGQVFDSSIPRGKPFDFILGAGEVIRGWDLGLLGMCEQEKRTLIIPPELAYGNRGAGHAIPGGATLKFDVECLIVGDGSLLPSSNQQQQRINGDPDLGPFAIFGFILFGFFATLALVLMVIILWKRFRRPAITATKTSNSTASVAPISVYSPLEHVVDEEENIEFTSMLKSTEHQGRSTEYRDAPEPAKGETISSSDIRLEENKLEEIKVL